MLTYVSRFLSGDLEPFWPHVVLLSVAVLASIAVGGGIIFERPKYPPSVHRVAFWLVVGGIAIEAVCTIFLFVFDEGISGAQQSRIEAQQLKIISLEKQIAPRELTEDQQKKIAEKIKPFAGTPFDLSMAQELEPMRLLDKIEDTLILGQWVLRPTPPTAVMFNRMNKPPVGIRTVAGIWILYPKQSGPSFERAATELAGALRDEQIISSLISLDPGIPSDLGVIHIWVGGKP
jgi:hypothetical protein